MLPSWADDMLTVLRAPYIDQRGSRVRDWDNAVPHVVAGCSVQPNSSSSDEGLTREDQVTASLVAYMPPGADIQSGDRVEYNGKTYDVDGDVLAWHSPTGALDHGVAYLRTYKG